MLRDNRLKYEFDPEISNKLLHLVYNRIMPLQYKKLEDATVND